MKTTRILSLLFSLFQFLLVLKLIEFVRGDPTQDKKLIALSSEEISGESRESRQFIFAPNAQKKRKLKPWVTSSEITTTDYPTNEDGSLETNLNNSSAIDRVDIVDRNTTKIQKNSTITTPEESARLCPGCVSGTCGGTVVPYGFPLGPLIVSVVVGVIWFFIFLYIWYYFTEPPKAGYAPSSGYGYEDSSGNSGWSPSDSSGWGSDSDSSGAKFSWWDLIKGKGKGKQQRSFDGFNQLTSFVTDSLFTLNSLYNNLNDL